MARRTLTCAIALALASAFVPAAQAGGRPPDGGASICAYRSPEAPPYDTPQGHVRVHWVADPADPDSPAPGSTRVAGVPDWVVAAGADAESAWARETALGFAAPPPDDADGVERGGDGRYDVYVCDLAAHGLGELGATVPDAAGAATSFTVVDDDYARAEVAPLATTGLDQLRVTIAHEVFHAIQLGTTGGRLPAWLAEATAVWAEGAAAPPDVDRDVYRVALGGRGTEVPYWRAGGLHEYGAWWLVDTLERGRPGFVRRLLALAAGSGDGDPDGLALTARAAGGTRALATAFARFARAALDDPLVGPALAARRAARVRPGGRVVLRAAVQSLALRLWRVPVPPGAVTLRRAGARGLAVIVRRGAFERAVPPGRLTLPPGRGPLLVLAAGGASAVRELRLTVSA
jgi:hypothetical protein